MEIFGMRFCNEFASHIAILFFFFLSLCVPEIHVLDDWRVCWVCDTVHCHDLLVMIFTPYYREKITEGLHG